MKIIFRTDSRDKVYQQKFGQTILLPDEINLDSTLIDDVQPIGDVKCTCYSTCDIAEDQQKREFDIDDLWARINKNQFGADPREPLGQAVSQGLLPKGQGQRVKDWKSYWSALQGSRDNFDNVRSALMMANSPVMVATYWYSEWLNIPALGVMPIGQNTLNGHAYVVEGWKQINGEPMLIVEAWVGRKMYMPRSTFNDCTKHYGMQAWVLSTSEIDARRQKTILETIKDACINVIILMKQLLLVKKTEAGEQIIPPVSPKPPVVEPKYDWSTPTTSKKSVRIICDEEGLTLKEKNELCATVGAESGWKKDAIGKPNFDGTRDYGIVQVNEKYWIGEGKLFPSKEYVLQNPEACVRWMCKEWRKNKNWWYAYKNGSYKKFL